MTGELAIRLTGGGHVFTPSSRVKGEAHWRLDDVPKAIEVRLVWRTKGKGTTDEKIVTRTSVELATINGSFSFDLRLPSAPYSLMGRLVSIVWSVDVVAKTSAWSRDLVHSETITVGPHERQVVLTYPPGEAES